MVKAAVALRGTIGNVRYGSLADIGARIRDVRFTLNKRTFISADCTSALCHKRTLPLRSTPLKTACSCRERKPLRSM